MSVKEQAGIILRDVGKGLVSIVVPPKNGWKPSEYLHYCEKCKKYHAVSPESETPKGGRSGEYLYLGKMHWCEKCKRYHKAG
mgnify:CR=1 FL=1